MSEKETAQIESIVESKIKDSVRKIAILVMTLSIFLAAASATPIIWQLSEIRTLIQQNTGAVKTMQKEPNKDANRAERKNPKPL